MLKTGNFYSKVQGQEYSMSENSKQHYLHNPDSFQIMISQGLGPWLYKCLQGRIFSIKKSDKIRIFHSETHPVLVLCMTGIPWGTLENLPLATKAQEGQGERCHRTQHFNSHLTCVLVTLIPPGSILQHLLGTSEARDPLWDSNQIPEILRPQDHGLQGGLELVSQRRLWERPLAPPREPRQTDPVFRARYIGSHIRHQGTKDPWSVRKGQEKEQLSKPNQSPLPQVNILPSNFLLEISVPENSKECFASGFWRQVHSRPEWVVWKRIA